MIIPLWQNNDEIEHFSYTYYLVEESKIPIASSGSHLELNLPDELVLSNKILESDKISFAVFEKNQIIHQDFNNIIDQEKLSDQLANESRLIEEEKYANAAAIYPPLYYYLEAIPYKIFQNFNIMTRAYAMRIFGIIFLLITVLYSFKIAKLFFKKPVAAYTTAILIGFLPRFSFTSAGINNDALLIAICTIAIYYLVRYLNEDLVLKNNLLLGLIFGIGLLSKPQFYIFFLFLFIFYLYKLIKYKKIKPILISLTTVIIISLLISSGWFYFNIVENNNLPANQIENVLFSNSNNSISTDFAITLKYVVIRYIFMITSFFSMMGCCHEIYTAPIFLGLFFATVAVIIFGYILLFMKRKSLFKDFKIFFIFVIPIILELSYLLLYLRQPIQTGNVDILIDGRYLYPLLSVLTIIFLIGLNKIVPKKFQHQSYIILICGIIFINLYTLIFNIIPRYYL